MPYRRAAQLLNEFLPLSNGRISSATVQRHALAVGRELDRRVTEPDEYDWPDSRRLPVPSAEHLTVVIDGTYVRNCSFSSSRLFACGIGTRIQGDRPLYNRRFRWRSILRRCGIEFPKREGGSGFELGAELYYAESRRQGV